MYNTDLITGAGPLQMYDTSTINDCFEGGLIAAYDVDGKKVSTGTGTKINMVSAKPITTLVFQYIGYLPLSFISPMFEKMPSVASIPNMELRITTNLSNNNKWTVEYGAAVNNVYPITGTTGIQSVGSICPFMLSQFSNDTTQIQGSIAISRVSNPVGALKVSVVPYIGYYHPGELTDNSISNGKINARQSSYPCRLVIPTIAYNSELRTVIYKQPAAEILYEDFSIDTSVVNRVGGSSVQHQLQNNLGRVRKLYIIPYFVSKNNSNDFVPVYQSLVSSAPTTCSPCKLGNFMVSLSSVNMFATPLAQSHDFYINSNLIGQAQINGNAFTSAMVSGQVPFSQWTSGSYQVYEVLLDRAIDQIADNENPTIQIAFKIMSKSDYSYNLLFLTTFQSVIFIDRVDGSIVSSASTQFDYSKPLIYF